MSKGWLELESDPGLFTLLLGDFGAHGVQVEEIYDLQKPIEGPVYGFIFLFKWIEERRSRRKVAQEEESFVMDDEIINNIFFAQQIISNSCATHALLSVLLNCDKLKIGDTLTQFKDFTKNMNPEDKGFAIGNMPDLAKAHNSHARPEPFLLPEKQQGISVRTKEAFHFVSFVPINGRLFELDGLKPSPIDHGPWGECEDWTEKFHRVISERLGMATGGEPYHDIRFNLMAVVPDRRQVFDQKLKTLKTNRQIVLEALQQMVNVTGSDSELSPDSRQAVRSGKAEQIVTRSISAKEASDAAPQPLRSARLKQKAEAAAAAAAATEKMDMDSSFNEEPEIIDAEHGNTDFKIIVDNRDDVLGLPTTVSHCSDITHPLCINTKFAMGSPGPGSSSTETASEVASFLSSPTLSLCNSAQCSPSVTPEKCSRHLHVANMELEEKLARARELQVQLEASGKSKKMDGGRMSADGGSTGMCKGDGMDTDGMELKGDDEKKLEESPDSARNRSKFGTHQGFTPKDLIELLKNVENEIRICEDNLREEVEKRKRYKIDDSRRTHSYDQFICTFLSMLAEQGHLAGLVEEHMLSKRRQGVNVGRLTKAAAKPVDKKRPKTKRKR